MELDLTLAELSNWAEEPITSHVLAWVSQQEGKITQGLKEGVSLQGPDAAKNHETTCYMLGQIDGLGWYQQLREEVQEKEEQKKEEQKANDGITSGKEGQEGGRGTGEEVPYGTEV